MSSHDQGHTERVKRLAVYIAGEEGADVEVVEKAAELHDIARGEPNHARRGAEIARRILQDQGYSADFISKVTHCIEAHSFSSGVASPILANFSLSIGGSFSSHSLIFTSPFYLANCNDF